jgi:hypothetical protein
MFVLFIIDSEDDGGRQRPTAQVQAAAMVLAFLRVDFSLYCSSVALAAASGADLMVSISEDVCVQF